MGKHDVLKKWLRLFGLALLHVIFFGIRIAAALWLKSSAYVVITQNLLMVFGYSLGLECMGLISDMIPAALVPQDSSESAVLNYVDTTKKRITWIVFFGLPLIVSSILSIFYWDYDEYGVASVLIGSASAVLTSGILFLISLKLHILLQQIWTRYIDDSQILHRAQRWPRNSTTTEQASRLSHAESTKSSNVIESGRAGSLAARQLKFKVKTLLLFFNCLEFAYLNSLIYFSMICIIIPLTLGGSNLFLVWISAVMEFLYCATLLGVGVVVILLRLRKPMILA